MTDPVVKSKVGATPGKLVLMAVLAVVLVSVLLVQLAGREEPPAAQETADASSLPQTGRSENGTSVPRSPPDEDDVLTQDRQGPRIALEEVLQHDPFALPRALRPPARPSSANTADDAPDEVDREEVQRQRERALAAIREQGVQMVFLGKEEQIAIIGDHRVRVGDQFEGFRVTDIGSDGVTLSEQE